VVIQSGPACRTCNIELGPKVNLIPPAKGLPGFPADVAVDHQGRIYLGFSSPPELMRFSSRGLPEEHWERPGEGPGEFRMIRYLHVTASDSLVVFDPVLQRASIFSPSGAFVRSYRSPGGMARPVETNDGRYVVNETIGQAARIGFPFHEFLAVGLIGRSFGSELANLRPTEHWRLRYVMSDVRGRGDEFWAVRTAGGYQIERWRIGGARPIEVLVREAEWFPNPASDELELPSLDTPPRPRVVGLWQDDAGLIWVALRVADPRWRTAIRSGAPEAESRRRAPRTGAAIAVQVTDPERYTDLRLEVIDPLGGVVVAARQFDVALTASSTPGVFIGYADDFDADDPTWAIVRPRLTGSRIP
jgi:hypothetical protein